MLLKLVLLAIFVGAINAQEFFDDDDHFHSFILCDSTGLANCMKPLIAFTQSPEVTEILETFGEYNITENQLKKTCKIWQNHAICLSEYAQRCVGGKGNEGLQKIFLAYVNILQVCDDPTMYAKAQVSMTCNKMLAATSPVYALCLSKAYNMGGRYLNLAAVGSKTVFWNMLRTGAVIRDTCCLLEDLNECSAAEYLKCKPEAAELNKKMSEAIFSALGCREKNKSDCPAQI